MHRIEFEGNNYTQDKRTTIQLKNTLRTTDKQTYEKKKGRRR